MQKNFYLFIYHQKYNSIFVADLVVFKNYGTHLNEKWCAMCVVWYGKGDSMNELVCQYISHIQRIYWLEKKTFLFKNLFVYGFDSPSTQPDTHIYITTKEYQSKLVTMNVFLPIYYACITPHKQHTLDEIRLIHVSCVPLSVTCPQYKRSLIIQKKTAM